MVIVEDKRTLIRALSAADPHLIAVDGWYGSGKSWFGRVAAHCIGRRWLDLDKLLEKGRQAFADHIHLSDLTNAVSQREPLVLSGICMREVLARIGNPEAVHVYVKRIHLGYWTHEEEAEGGGREVDEIFPPSPLECEVRAYHEAWKPHCHADFLYKRTANPAGR